MAEATAKDRILWSPRAVHDLEAIRDFIADRPASARAPQRPTHRLEGLDAGAPDLAIEVISPASIRYDRREKLQGYAEIGVFEYWVIDPNWRLPDWFTA